MSCKISASLLTFATELREQMDTGGIHDRFATRADIREGDNSSFVHSAQVTTVLGSEGLQGRRDLRENLRAGTSAYQRDA